MSNNIYPLPIYTRLDLQDYQRRYSHGVIYRIIAPKQTLIPFQYHVRVHGIIPYPYPYPIIKAVSILDGSEILISSAAIMNNVIRFLDNDYEHFIYTAQNQININLPVGTYYLRITPNGSYPFYSDVFDVVDSVDDCLRIDWWGDNDIVTDSGEIMMYGSDAYGREYRNFVYLQEDIAKPEYLFEEEGEMRDGYFFPEKRTSEKRYKFTALMDEPMIDALRIIPLSEHIVITDQRGIVYNPDTFHITAVNWQEQANIAAVDIEFSTNTIIKTTGYVQPIEHIVHSSFNQSFNQSFTNTQTNGRL